MCLQFTHFPCDGWGNIYTLSHYHQQIGSMNCKSLFRFWPWNNGIRCMYLYILIVIWHTNPIDLSTFETRPNDLTNKSIFLRPNSQFWCHHFMFLTEMYHETSDRSLVRVTCAVIKRFHMEPDATKTTQASVTSPDWQRHHAQREWNLSEVFPLGFQRVYLYKKIYVSKTQKI